MPGAGTVDPAAAQTVSTSLPSAQDPAAGAQTLSSSLASASAASVAKGFQSAVVSNPDQAQVASQSFAQASASAAQTGGPALTKTVTSFSISIAFLAATGNVQLAQTCVAAFTTHLAAIGGCDVFVVEILQVYIQVSACRCRPRARAPTPRCTRDASPAPPAVHRHHLQITTVLLVATGQQITFVG